MLTKPLNRYIDHTLLSPTAKDTDFEKFLDEAVKYNFKAVCVSPYIAVPVSAAMKPYPDISVGTVVAFPHGNIPLPLKLNQVAYFLQYGVQEIDWVLHFGEVFNGRWENIVLEMGQVANLCRQGNAISKCIVESSVINDPTFVDRLFRIVQNTGVDFIKTSTGFNGEGARLADVKIWNSIRSGSPTPYIKASGGIKTVSQALSMIAAGADRLGMSASVSIMEEHNTI